MMKVNLLFTDGLQKTGATKKMNIKGKDENMVVYRIPLDLLYYNDQNDRIATYISKYNAEHKDQPLKTLPVEERNNEIEKYIKESDQDKFVDTRENIRKLGQMEPGVVLSDGRIIDGNRRFTCLRSLHKELGQKFGYYEAVILDEKDINEKQIKLMELILQHGVNARVGYNPIQKLVGIYRDIVKDKTITVEEYANCVDETKKSVEKNVELAKLMEDFLEYMHAPEEFYIAKDLEIDGPLHEIYIIKNRIGENQEKWSKARIVLYDMMALKTKSGESGDITRNIREFGKNVIENDSLFDEYFNEHMPESVKIHETMGQTETKISTEDIRKLRGSLESIKIKQKVEKIIDKTRKIKARNKPIETLKSVNDELADLDISLIERMSGENRKEFINQLDSIKSKIDQINQKLDNAI